MSTDTCLLVVNGRIVWSGHDVAERDRVVSAINAAFASEFSHVYVQVFQKTARVPEYSEQPS